MQAETSEAMTERGGQHLLIGLEGLELTGRERERFARIEPAGYVLFSRNMQSAEQVRELTDELRSLSYFDPIIAVDEEGGRVSRMKTFAPSLPAAEALARHGDMGLIADAGALTGEMLALLGFNLNFAPVLDVDHFPERGNALRSRCWGGDSQRVIDRAGHWNRWMRKRGMASCAKHFPGGGRAESDPHDELPGSPASRDQLLADDIIPYTALMPGIDAVMTGHVCFSAIDAEWPASLSPVIVGGLLRDQLGLDRHLVITDDLDMGAVQAGFAESREVAQALRAGNDVAMICHQHERVEEAAARVGELAPGITMDAEKRIERFRRKRPAAKAWNAARWKQLCDEAESLSKNVPGLEGDSDGGSGSSHSAVMDY